MTTLRGMAGLVFVIVMAAAAYFLMASRSAERQAIDSRLAELVSGTPSPLEMERRRGLSELWARAKAAGYREQDVSKELLRYPLERSGRQVFAANATREGIVISGSGDRVFLWYHDKIEAYDRNCTRLIGTFRQSRGRIGWACADPFEDRIVFEVVFEDLADEVSAGRSPEEQADLSTALKSRRMFVRGKEVAFFSTDCNQDVAVPHGMSRKFDGPFESWNSRGDMTERLESVATGVSRENILSAIHENYRVERPWFMEKDLPPIDSKNSVPKHLCFGSDGESSLSLMQHRSGPCTLSYPIASARRLQIPQRFGFVEDTGGELGRFARHIQVGDAPCVWQLLVEPLEFEPAAVNLARGRVLLRDRLFLLSDAGIDCKTLDFFPDGEKDKISQGWTNVKHLRFSRDGQFVIMEYRNRVIDLWDVASGKRVRRFLPSIQVHDVAIGADADFVYVIEATRAVVRWEFNAFGPSGWADLESR